MADVHALVVRFDAPEARDAALAALAGLLDAIAGASEVDEGEHEAVLLAGHNAVVALAEAVGCAAIGGEDPAPECNAGANRR